MPRYRVKFEERTVYEVEFETDVDLEAWLVKSNDPRTSEHVGVDVWFNEMDAHTGDWRNEAGFAVMDRDLFELKRLTDLDVECKFCHAPTSSKTAHRHQLGWVCENCWDERLRSTA